MTFGNSLYNKADKPNTCLKTDVDVLLYSLQAGTNNRVLSNAVDINGICKLLATSNDRLNHQKVDGSVLYDSLELSFNTVDKTSTWRVNHVDMLASLASRISSSNIYTKQEIHDVKITFF